jgi:hypothetical protein
MSQGVRIINNKHLGYKNHTKSDTVVLPAPYNDGIVILTAGTAVIETYDSSGDDLTLTFVAGDVWYANIKFVKSTSTCTHMGIRLNKL